jgi:hypothetical protein
MRELTIAMIGCAALFAVSVALGQATPRTAWGVGFGSAAALLLFADGLYAVRRRSMQMSSRLQLGRSRTWLRVHVVGGTVFMLLVLMHTGFVLPHGGLTWVLWLLSIWTVATGMIGLGLQKSLPRALATLTTEINYDRIPALVDEVRNKAEALAQESSEPIRALFDRQLVAQFAAPRRRLSAFVDAAGRDATTARAFEYLRGLVADDERERLDELDALVRTKREIDTHYTLQHALRIWLYVHVPPSLALVGAVLIHVATVLYY